MLIKFNNPLILSGLILVLVILISQLFLCEMFSEKEGFSIEIPYTVKSKKGDREETIKLKLDDPKLVEQVKKMNMEEIQKLQQTYFKAYSEGSNKPNENKKGKK